MTEIVNLTDHTLTLLTEVSAGGQHAQAGRGTTARAVQVVVLADIAPSGIVAEVLESSEGTHRLHVAHSTVPLDKRHIKDVLNLPPPQADTLYFVSRYTLLAARELGRSSADLVAPGETVTRHGKPLGTLTLIQL